MESLGTSDKELSGVGTLTGAPEQVRAGFGRLHAKQVIALTFDGSEAAVRALADTAANLAPLVRNTFSVGTMRRAVRSSRRASRRSRVPTKSWSRRV